MDKFLNLFEAAQGTAQNYKILYDAFISIGFNEDQAFELLLVFVNGLIMLSDKR